MKKPEVVPLPRRPPRRGVLAKRIGALVADGAFSYASGAFDEADGREIDLGDAMEVLTTGAIEGEIIRARAWANGGAGWSEGSTKSAKRLAVESIVIRDVH